MHLFFADIYNRLEELHQDLHQTLEGLPQEAVDWNPGPEMNSLAILASHTAGAERYWIGDVIAGDYSNRHRASEFKAYGQTASQLQEQLLSAKKHSLSVLAQLSLEDLSRQCTAPSHPDHTFSVGWSLAHALEHTAVHLGHMQVIRQLWEQRQAS